MGNKQTISTHNNPERSFSWQPDPPSKSLPPRRNSFATQPIVPNGNIPSPIMPRGYAASELGSPRYQKRVPPVTSSSKLGTKANLRNAPRREKPTSAAPFYDNTMQRPPVMGPLPPRFLPPPPMPFYGSGPIGSIPPPVPFGAMLPCAMPPGPIGPPPGPMGPPLGPMGSPRPPMPFMYPPYGPPPPMDPNCMSLVPASNDSKRIQKLRQRQKQRLIRNESVLTTASDFLPSGPMYAIMPPPRPMSPQEMYSPAAAIYRARSMDNVHANAKSLEIKKHIFPTNTLATGPKRINSSQSDLAVRSRPSSKQENYDTSKKSKARENINESMKKKLQQKPQILHLIKDGLTSVPESEMRKIPLLVPKTDNERKSTGTLIKSSWPPDVIYESLKGGNPILAKKGKGARKANDSSPTAINIHFDYNDKDKIEKFVPSVTTVSSDAQAIMERNSKRLADAEWEDAHKPGTVVVNEDEKENYENDNNLNERKLLYGCLPPRKVDAEVYEQRSLQRPGHSLRIQSLRPERELTEIVVVEPLLSKITTTSRSSSQKSSKSSQSKQSVKMAKNPAEKGELMIEAVLNPVLNQQKTKRSNEFKALHAWNDINVCSEVARRSRSGFGGSGHFQRGAVDEKIVVRLIPSPPSKQLHNQEPIYLDYDKTLPEFKKRLIETGNFEFPEMEKFHGGTNTLKSDTVDTMISGSKTIQQSNRSENGDTLRSNKLTTPSKNGSKRQKYLMENRSKSNMERESDHLVTLTPSIAKIKAGDCSDIDFSWVDDLETRFRLEREQFERELRNIKERTIQRGIKPLQPDDKTPTPSQSKNRSYSIPTNEPSADNSTVDNSPKEDEYAQFNFQNKPNVSRYFGDFDVKTNDYSGSNYLRDYSGPKVDVKKSSNLEDTIRSEATQTQSAVIENESRCQPRAVYPDRVEFDQLHNSNNNNNNNNNRVPVEEEPIYIPKPDYEQMENEAAVSNFSSSQFNPNDILNYAERFQIRSDYNPYFDRSLTVQTAQIHENTKRAYSTSSPRSPSQRKLNRYYNANGTSNLQSSDCEWIEAEPETSRDRYNMQLGGSYSINPNIANDFKHFDTPDKTVNESQNQTPVLEYNGSQYYHQNKIDEDHTREFVEKMNEMSFDEQMKWSRNPGRQNRFTHSMTNGQINGSYGGVYVSRPPAMGSSSTRMNFSRGSNGNHVYGSSHY